LGDTIQPAGFFHRRSCPPRYGRSPRFAGSELRVSESVLRSGNRL